VVAVWVMMLPLLFAPSPENIDAPP
jgi:hypothetical protein